MSVKVDYKNAIKGIDANGKPLDLDTIYITAGGFVNRAFKGLARDSVWGINETVWGGNLTRTRGTFALENIENVDFGIVPRCEITFKYMNVQDYLDLCKIAQQRTMTVNFFNRDLGQRQTLEMAMTNQDRGNLYNYGSQEYIGNFDIKIKLVATNRELTKSGKGVKTFTVKYNTLSASWKIDSQSAKWSNVITIATPPSNVTQNLRFKEWNTSSLGTGAKYLPGEQVTLWQDLTLYAVYDDRS